MVLSWQLCLFVCFFFSSRRRHTRCSRDWSSDVCSSDLRPTSCKSGPSYFPVQKRALQNTPSVGGGIRDRKSTRLNSSHGYISYAVFCLKKKNSTYDDPRTDVRPPRAGFSHPHRPTHAPR